MQGLTALISGAGIAGPALAHELLRAGFTPTLVESSNEFRSTGHVIDFWGQGYDIIEKMGLLDEVLHAGYNMRSLRLVDRFGETVGGFDASVFRTVTGSRFTTLQRGALAEILYRSIEGRAQVMFGTTITALEPEPDGVFVRFDRGKPQRFDCVVGADGLHSRVRSLAFGPEARFEHFLGYVAAAFEVHGYRPRDPDVYVTHAAPGRQIVRFALHGDRTMFLFVIADPDVVREYPCDRDSRKAYLRERFGRVGWECPAILAALDASDDLYFDRVSQIRMNHWHKGRIALLGDAAYAPSLLAGQGAAFAIMGAHVLAGELARAARVEDAFSAYEKLLQPFLAHKQRAAARFARWFAPQSRTAILVRQWMTHLFDYPLVARLSMGSALRDRVVLPGYPALTSGSDLNARVATEVPRHAS
jgi:2-polyprenyl-6-methoxyphenol hydroxylase-like FAD-dependent oxidoreductase